MFDIKVGSAYLFGGILSEKAINDLGEHLKSVIEKNNIEYFEFNVADVDFKGERMDVTSLLVIQKSISDLGLRMDIESFTGLKASKLKGEDHIYAMIQF